MATYNGFDQFVEDLGLGVHNLNTDTIKIYLSNTTPVVATHAVKTDLAEFGGGTGYTAGGEDIVNTYSQTSGTGTVATGANPSWTATAGDWVAFQYVVAYNDTQTSPADPLIAYWDYGSALTLGNGESFTVTFTGSKLMDIA